MSSDKNFSGSSADIISQKNRSGSAAYDVNNKIDIVINWVDGLDPEWQASREEQLRRKGLEPDPVNRFRNWGLLKYFFRGIEKNAPWVHKVYFVTCGHVPKWLNLDHPKLVHVRHEEYIPEEFLPTFNSAVIEMHFHRIKGLSEQFIYLNDDMYMIRPTKSTDFFRDGKPVMPFMLGTLHKVSTNDLFTMTLANNMGVINKYFTYDQIKKNARGKIYLPTYGRGFIRNLCLMPFKYVSDFYNMHLQQCILKSVMEHVWELEGDIFNEFSTHRFREIGDYNAWVMVNWQLSEGNFYPCSESFGRKYELGDDKNITEDVIRHKKYKIICLNDSSSDTDYETVRDACDKMLARFLPEKSSFEL